MVWIFLLKSGYVSRPDGTVLSGDFESSDCQKISSIGKKRLIKYAQLRYQSVSIFYFWHFLIQVAGRYAYLTYSLVD